VGGVHGSQIVGRKDLVKSGFLEATQDFTGLNCSCHTHKALKSSSRTKLAPLNPETESDFVIL
jgi:hypothetical protein